MGKSSKPVVGFWYRVAYHHGLTTGPIDAFLEFRGGDKTAWQGELTASGTISINAPHLWGGEKDQGGIVGDVDVMFGEPTQVPNPYLVSTFGAQTAAWRGFTTLAFKGGRYGAMNPYPQKPSYKFRRITEGWDGDLCWYQAAAVVPLSSGALSPIQQSVQDFTLAGGGFETNLASAFTASITTLANTVPNVSNGTYWRRVLPGWAAFTGIAFDFQVLDPRAGDPLSIGLASASGQILFQFNPRSEITIDANQRPAFNYEGIPVYATASTPLAAGATYSCTCALDFTAGTFAWSLLAGGTTVSSGSGPLSAIDVPHYLYFDRTGNDGVTSIAQFSNVTLTGRVAGAGANPAHVLYDSRTNAEMGREPTTSINDASLRGAADKLYAEGFGICPKWDPTNESVEDFEKRICKLIGGSFTRSLEDGQWYLDLARGDYVLDDLPILTDDDILDFKEQPSILDNAVNSVSVRYFDPEKKETIVTPPVRSLALVASFGTIHQTVDYPEIPTGDLATRVALRDLLATATPTRVFDLVVMPRARAPRPNQYFRLQALKRGIADMVCIVADKQTGTLKSGAIRLKAAQDIYGLPATSFVQVEPGVDTRPSQTPTAIALQRAFEAPYVEVVASMSRADLAVLPADVGYAMAVAADPAGDIDYTMMVAPVAGSYADVARGDWCATATVNDAAGYLDTEFTLVNGKRLDAVVVGMAAVWDSELLRVDAIDVTAGTITLGRGCADTVPVTHAANSRLWFYPTGAARDTTEYTDAETIDVKLLSRTGSQQLSLDDATALPVTFASRAARPYPPGQLRINGAADPSSIVGAITVAGVHRDRVQQADQLVDSEMAGIGPEAGTTYTARYYLNGTLVQTDTGLAVPASTYTPDGAGIMRVEFESVRDGLTSYQMHVREFAIGQPLLDESGALITTEDDQLIIMG